MAVKKPLALYGGKVKEFAATDMLASGYGGTGFSTYAAGDLIYASAVNTLAKLTAGTNGYVLTLAGGLPTWAAAGGGGGSVAGSNTQIQYNNAGAFGASSTFTYKASSAAISGLAQGLSVTPALTAAANNDILVGVDINPTFSNGAFTGVKNYSLRVTGNFYTNCIYNDNSQGNKLLMYDGGSTSTRNGIGWKNGVGTIIFTYGGNQISFVSGQDATNATPTNYFTSSGLFTGNITATGTMALTGGFSLNISSLGKNLRFNTTNGQQILLYDGGSSTTRMGIDFVQSVGMMYYAGYGNPILFGLNKDNSTVTQSNAELKLMSDGRLVIGAGTTGSTSALIEGFSTTLGFLPPRMTTTQKAAIASPAEGLEVYDTTLHKKCVFTGSVWETVTSS